MELNDVLLKRRSVRNFTNEEVSDSQIDEIMHAAMSGPSAMNKCPWEFYVIRNDETLQKIRKSCRYSNYNGQVAIVVVGDLAKALPFGLKDFWVQDCSAATENILLRAVDLGLGGVWCGVHPQEKEVGRVQEILGLSKKEIPLNIIWIGHPSKEPEARDQYNKKRVHII